MAFTKLKKALGPFGFLADALSVAQTNWGVIVSAIIALGATVWNKAYGAVTNPHVETFGMVFLLSIWTYLALSALYRLHRGVRTIPVLDYAYGVIIEGMQLAYEKAEDQKEESFQIGINLRNVVNGAIRMEVHEFRVVIDGRTIPDSPVVHVIFPRFAVKGVMGGTVKKDVFKGRIEGHANLLVHYGPLEGPLVRKYRIRTKLFFKPDGESMGVANSIESEEDGPL